MKIQFTAITLLVTALSSGVMASSGLTARHNKFPLKVTDGMVTDIMTGIKSQINTQVVSSISSSYCSQVSSSLDFSRSFNISSSTSESSHRGVVVVGSSGSSFESSYSGSYEVSHGSSYESHVGGVIIVGSGKSSHVTSSLETEFNLIKKSFLKQLKIVFESRLNAEIKTSLYKELEILLRSKCGSKKITEKQLLLIIAEVEAKAKGCLQTRLIKIGEEFKKYENKHFELVLKKINIKSSIIKKISFSKSLSSIFSGKAYIKKSFSSGIKACTKWNTTQSAKRVIKSIKELKGC